MKFPPTRLALILLTVFLGYFAGCTGTPADGTDLMSFPDPTEECVEDVDCPASEPICDELAGCVECQYHDECGDGRRCYERTCVTATVCTESVQCTAEQPVCDPSKGYCVQCATSTDCGPDARCIGEACEPATACINSRDCAEGEVCDPTLGFCVECASDLDCVQCPEGAECSPEVCVENSCEPICVSDKDCVDADLLCDINVLHCVECLRNADCPDSYHCAGGKCAADLCRPSEAACVAGANVVLSCNEEGNGLDIEPCASATTCVDGELGPECRPWTCSPGLVTCDTTTSLVACNEDGLGMSNVDCAAQGGVCVAGACEQVVCTANQYTCMNGASMLCNSNGTVLSLAQACADTSYCSSATGSCQLDACVAGSSICTENVVQTCAIDGSAYEAGEDCSAVGETCYNGECRPELCTKAQHCYDGNVYHCQEDGTVRTLYDTCTATEACDDSGALAYCEVVTCEPGEPTCQGDLAGTCNAAGTGITSVVTDCESTNQACHDGSCMDIVCEGIRHCDDAGDVRACVNSGTAEGNLVQDCQEDEYCWYDDYSDLAYCFTDACSEGDTACLDGDLAHCNADGSGYEVQEGCPEGEACVGDGTCLPEICEPYLYHCMNGNVFLCGADGTTNQLISTCTPGQYCTGSYCATDVCTSGVPYCSGANLSTCATDGSGPADAGTPCPDGDTCVSGACVEVVCEPSGQRCFEGNVQTCNSTGTGWSNSGLCGATYYCDDTEPAAPVCLPDVCQAGQPACGGETLATCGTDGGSYVDQTTDCSLTDQICDKTACVDIQELLLATGGSSTATTTGRTYLNRFFVHTERRLVEIEQQFTVSGTSQFTFVVYRSSTGTGSFTQVFEKLVTGSPSADYVSSGAIDVTLEPGYFYAIGVYTFGSYSYFWQALAADSYESFARFEGGYSTTNQPDPTLGVGDTTTTYRQRLTLLPPL